MFTLPVCVLIVRAAVSSATSESMPDSAQLLESFTDSLPSALKSDAPGAVPDPDDALWHERFGDWVLSSNFLTRIFPGVARRAQKAAPYIASTEARPPAVAPPKRSPLPAGMLSFYQLCV